MTIPTNIDQLERTKFTPDASGDVAIRTVVSGSNATLYAVVNTGAVGVQNSLVTLLSGPNQIGSVTVSHPINLNTGTNWIGLATTVVASAPTLYAVVNTGAVGNQNSLATLLAGPNQIGSVTVSNPVQLAAGTNFIGLATTIVGNTINALLGSATNYIGLATVIVGSALPAGTNAIGKLSANSGVDIGDVDITSIAAGNNNIGDVDIASALPTGANWIGLATVNIGSANTVSASFSGNVTLNPSPNYIGLVTTTVGAALPAGTNAIGKLAANTGVDIGDVDVTSLPAIPIGANWIGLATVNIGSANTVQASFSGNVTLNPSPNYIGLATVIVGAALPTGTNSIGKLGANSGVDIGDVDVTSLPALSTGTNWLGLATVNIGSSNTVSASFSGNVTLNPSPNFIGLATVVVGSALPAGTNAIGKLAANSGVDIGDIDITSIAAGDNNIGNVDVVTLPALSTGTNYIGLATVNIGSSNATLYAVVNTAAAGTQNSLATLLAGPNQIGSVTISNNPALGAGTAYIGLASVNIGGTLPALSTGANWLGLATVWNSNQPALVAGAAYIGLASVNIGGTLPALIAGTAYIGLASVNVGGTLPALTTGSAYIGLVTAVPGLSMATVTLGTRLDTTTDSITTKNGGTTKTLIPLPIAFSTGSIATIAIPTGGNAIFYVTNLLISSNATVRMNIKSGATYLTGNVSLGVNLNPGGGWVENGSPDSPVYLGLASGAAIVVEKADFSGNIAQIGGKVMYFQE